MFSTKKIRTYLAYTLLATVFLFATTVNAATLNFDPEFSNVAIDESFIVSIDLDSGAEQVAGTDIYIDYDKDLLSLQSVTGGDFFPLVNNIPTAGRLYISGVVANQGEFKTGLGTVATVTFKSLIAGSGTLEFDCDITKTDTSKIVKNDFAASNIIDCSQLKTHTVTSSVDGTATVTPTTAAGGSGGTGGTGGTLPESGAIEEMITYSAIGGGLLLFGFAIRMMLRVS